jgi:hypothetical protein
LAAGKKYWNSKRVIRQALKTLNYFIETKQLLPQAAGMGIRP